MSSQSRSRPRATYRLQFNRDFTFDDAAALVPYLHRLGISHCYASPLLKARSGSMHGYDIVDHRQLNPELGDRAAFDRLVNRLHDHDMGLIVDIVPNHMGVGGADNAWWQDVLENGPAAEYADFFDIDWRPAHETLRGKVLLPLLGDRYGKVLDDGEIELVFIPEAGTFHFAYYEHQLPLDPVTYPAAVAPLLEDFRRLVPPEDPGLAELENLLTAFAHLPGRESRESGRRQERRRDKEITKQRLAELCRRDSRIADLLKECVLYFNHPSDPAIRGQRLHNLLELQVYRPAHWVVAGDEINYRRFFDINSLAGLQAEREDVFAATHGLILELVAAGSIDGLRVDHPDGLSDPAAYFSRLQAAAKAAAGGIPPGAGQAGGSSPPAGTYPLADLNSPPAGVTGDSTGGIYLVVEKILATYEYLPQGWQVHGTTGYDFTNQVNGLFVRPDHETVLSRIYHRFVGRRLDFDELLYQRKKMIVTGQLSSELTVLSRLLKDIAEGNRHTRDFTLNGLREALIEVTACFPVYRTYIVPANGGGLARETATGPEHEGTEPGVVGDAAPPYEISVEDRRFVAWAVAQARKRGAVIDTTIYDFIHDILLGGPLEQPGGQPPAAGAESRAGGAEAVNRPAVNPMAVNPMAVDPMATVAPEGSAAKDPEEEAKELHKPDLPERAEPSAATLFRARRARFIRKFQQYTAPVMAKALEDTTFYIANRLISLNEVGGDPRRFYLSPAGYHRAAQERLRRWPQAMLATSTHDNKRSEDVRARINVISEVPELFVRHLRRWRRQNRSRKSRVNGRQAPAANDEYLFYQTLLGSWPLDDHAPPEAGTDFPADYRPRLQEYMLKAIREAKTHSSWINPNADYEEATARFVEQVLDGTGGNPFLADFIPVVRRLTPYGLLNSLAQVLLKLTSPGVPDFYQGTELWDFSLVDPDNRRPVDYHRRQQLLAALPEPGQAPDMEALQEMLANFYDGRLKLFLINRLLCFRRQLPELFRQGSYLPLVVEGGRQDHVCAFIRQWEDHRLLVASGRWFATLAGEASALEAGEIESSRRQSAEPGDDLAAGGAGGGMPRIAPEVWGDTRLVATADMAGSWQNLLTGELLSTTPEKDQIRLTCADLFAKLPMAVLYFRVAG